MCDGYRYGEHKPVLLAEAMELLAVKLQQYPVGYRTMPSQTTALPQVGERKLTHHSMGRSYGPTITILSFPSYRNQRPETLRSSLINFWYGLPVAWFL